MRPPGSPRAAVGGAGARIGDRPVTPRRTLPNLFIIGAMKSGTTSLHEYLHEHPDIFMARFKEPQYFAPHRIPLQGDWGQGNPLPEPGIDWYLRLFDGAGDVKYAGESSTTYTKEPRVTGCARRIHEFNPGARLIYILRDPIERTISHYWHNVAGLMESRPMLEAIRRRDEYTAYSHYARQLRPYLDRFDPSSIYVNTLENLTACRQEVLRDIFAWLGVDPSFQVQNVDHHNVGARTVRKVRRGFEGLARARRHWRWRWFEASCPGIARLVDRAMARPIDRVGADPGAVVAYLRPLQREQTRELTALIGREFPEWATLYQDDTKALTPVRQSP
jgi:hypothetical protein